LPFPAPEENPVDRALAPAVIRLRTFRRVGIAAAVVAAAWVVLAVVPSWLKPSVQRSRMVTARVERGAIEAGFEASGVVAPASEAVVSSPLETRVIKVLKHPGDAVRQGEPILELDTSAAGVEAERLERRLEQQKSELGRLDIESEEKLADIDGRIEVQRMEQEILHYRAGQQQALSKDGLISEGARREAEVAERKGEVALRQLTDSREGASRTEAARRESLVLDIAMTEADLAQARRKLEQATTRAERDAVLTWVVDPPGATVRQGEPVARLADLGSFRVEATVSDIHAARLAPGQRAHVVLGDEALDGHVATIEPAIDQGTVRFTVELARPDHPGLRSNLRVDVWVVTEERENVLRVRKGPFVQGGGAVQQVFVIDGDRAVRVDARMGLAGREHLEILSGLEPGDEVIVSDMRDQAHLREVAIH
jgi:HlyD family secretion protein